MMHNFDKNEESNSENFGQVANLLTWIYSIATIFSLRLQLSF